MSKEEIIKIIENLPKLSDRLHNWKNLLIELNEKETEYLNDCISLDSSTSLEDLIKKSKEIEEYIEYYKSAFNFLIDRLSKPLSFYNDIIDEISGKQFRINCSNFRKEEHLRCEKKAIDLAINYRSEYDRINNQFKTHWGYINDCNGMVTGFLFTPNIFPAENQQQRNWREEIFKGWNPESYCITFRKKLSELFKDS